MNKRENKDMSKVISFIKDPHLAFINNEVPRCLLLCEYRILVENNEGFYKLISASKDDFAGIGASLDEIESNLHLRECLVCTPEIVVEQVDYWVNNDHADPYKTLLEIIEYIGKAGVVLSGADMKQVYLLMEKYNKM